MIWQKPPLAHVQKPSSTNMTRSGRDQRREFRLAVVTSPFHDEAGKASLTRFIQTLEPLSKEIFAITGDLPCWDNERIHIMQLNTDLNTGTLLTRIFKFVLTEIRTSWHLVRISRSVEVIIFFTGTGPYLLSTLCAKSLGKRVILWATGQFSYSARQRYSRGVEIMAKIVERVRYAIADRIAVESQSVSHFLGLERYRQKTEIGPRYVPVTVLSFKDNLESRENSVGYIGRLVGGKGVMEFIDAMSLVIQERHGTKFLVGGGGTLSNEVQQKLESYGLCDEVTVTGWLSHEQVPDCLDRLKLLVLPSETEGLPSIIQEAMACGTPVLATPVGAVPDLISDGETGFILEDNSPQCIAQNVIRALDYANLAGVARNARALVEERYSYEAIVESYRKLLDGLNLRT